MKPIKKYEVFEQFIALISLLTIKNPTWNLSSIYLTAAGKSMPDVPFEDFCKASVKIQHDSSLESIFDSYWDVCFNHVMEKTNLFFNRSAGEM